MTRPSVLLITSTETYREWLFSLLQEEYSISQQPPNRTPRYTSRPDLLLVTWEPGITGLLASLRASFGQTPLLVLSREVGANKVAEVFRAGVDDILIKPTESEILSAIHRLLASSARPSIHKLTRWARKYWQKLKESTQIPLDHVFCVIPNPFIQTEFVVSESASKQDDRDMDEAPKLNVQLFGTERISVDGMQLPVIKSRKGMGVLAYLLCQHPRPVSRNRLMELFWADVLPDSARNSLNVALYSLRKTFQKVMPGADPIQHANGCYKFHPEWEIQFDVAKFKEAWRIGQSIEYQQGLEASIEAYEEALELYHGDFLADYRYLDWAETERENYRETYLILLERITRYRLANQSYEAVRMLSKRIIETDPCREQAYRQLMESLYRLGYRSQAIKQYQRCCAALKRELGVAPSDQTTDLYRKIVDKSI